MHIPSKITRIEILISIKTQTGLNLFDEKSVAELIKNLTRLHLKLNNHSPIPVVIKTNVKTESTMPALKAQQRVIKKETPSTQKYMHFGYLCRKLKSAEFRQTSWTRLSQFQLETWKGITINYLKSPLEGLNMFPMPFSGVHDISRLSND